MSAPAAAAAPPQAPPTRELVILRCTPLKSGPRKDGRGQWTIYNVHAKTPAGELVSQKLRAWDLLPMGLPARTYEVQKDDNERYGATYFLRLPALTKTEMRLMLDELFAHNAEVERRLSDFDRRLGALESGDQGPNTTTDDEIPW